jgi:hypothetical protein
MSRPPRQLFTRDPGLALIRHRFPTVAPSGDDQGKGAAMCASRQDRPSVVRQFVLVLAAAAVFAVMIPVGARAVGQLVTLSDPVTEGKARVQAPGALRVAEYNDPARRPFLRKGDVTMLAGETSQYVEVARLTDEDSAVIETISIQFQLPSGSGQRVLISSLSFTGMTIALPVTFTGSDSTYDYYRATHRVQLYVPAGSSIGLTTKRYPTIGTGRGSVYLVGHYVKV